MNRNIELINFKNYTVNEDNVETNAQLHLPQLLSYSKTSDRGKHHVNSIKLLTLNMIGLFNCLINSMKSISLQ